jgi:threonine synthase
LIGSFKEEINSHGIGDTIFTRSRNIEKLLDFSQIWLKFEGGNPTGTMKDRAAYACLKLAKKGGFGALAIASCGNFGASFVHLSKIFGIEPNVYVPSQYHTPRIREMERAGGVLHRAPGTYEELVELSGREAEENGWFNANPGVEANTRASMEAYATISKEIFGRLGYAPDVVSVPVGNGTTLAGVHMGFRALRERGEADKVPVMVAASTAGGNPVVGCFLRGLKKIKDLEPSEIAETEHNEPLVSWRSLDGQLALDALWESGGWAAYVSDENMLAFSEILAHEEGLLVLPASASSLAALAEYAKGQSGEKRARSYVAVLTGRRH